MNVIKYIFLVVFFSVITTHIEDVSGNTTNVSDREVVRRSVTISGILRFPFQILKTVLSIPYRFVLRPIYNVVSNVVKFVIKLITQIQTVNVEFVSEIIALVKQIIAQIVDILVDLGVLQGKTVEEIVDSVIKLIMKLIDFVVKTEWNISSSIIDIIENFIDRLNIREILRKIADLPVIKQLVKLIKDIRNFITQNFQTQIDDIRTLIRTQFEKHRHFFQPILDGISSRILIISNALQALINGDLQACAGDTNPNNSPTGSLQWELNKLIDQIRVWILRVLGFQDLADEYQEKFDEIDTTVAPPQAEPTILPPILSTLAGGTPPPFGSITVAPE